jgi:hypothetical protein
MIHLSGIDASFLHLEAPEMPKHVASLQIADLPEGYAGDCNEDVKRWMATRMLSIPDHGIALSMTVQSYNGSLEVGLTRHRRRPPRAAAPRPPRRWLPTSAPSRPLRPHARTDPQGTRCNTLRARRSART